MPHAAVPPQLTNAPFRGTSAVAKGLLSKRQLSGRTWQRLLPDIYAWEGLTLDHRTRCIAACLFLDGRGAISGLDAAALRGADATRRGAPIEVTVPDKITAPPGLRVLRSRLLAEDCYRSSHLRMTTPRRTAFDLARRNSPYSAIPGIDAMLHIRLVTREQVLALSALRRGWHGRTRIPVTLSLCDGRAESPQESRLRLVLVAGGLPTPHVQHEVRRNGRVVARLDLAYPEHRLGIEYDGDHHRSRSTFQNDLRRLNDLRTCGWTVLRFSNLLEPKKIRATVRAALATSSPR